MERMAIPEPKIIHSGITFSEFSHMEAVVKMKHSLAALGCNSFAQGFMFPSSCSHHFQVALSCNCVAQSLKAI